MNARESAAYIKRILAREDAWKEMESQLSGLKGELFSRPLIFAITRDVQDGSISSICVSAVTYDMTTNSINGIAENGKKEKRAK